LLGAADSEPSAHDEAFAASWTRVAPPVTHSGPVPATIASAPDSHVGSVRPIRDTELEVTATAEPPVVTDTDLEIIGPRPVPAPGSRLRPSQPLRPPGIGVPPKATASETTTGELGEGTAAPTAVGAATDDPGALPAAPVRVDVLGAPRVFWRPDADMTDAREVTGAFQPRTRELLVFLALHPDGASRETL